MPSPLTDITYIKNERFHALIEALKQIEEFEDETLDKAITDALIEIGGIAPASWEAIHKARAAWKAAAMIERAHRHEEMMLDRQRADREFAQIEAELDDYLARHFSPKPRIRVRAATQRSA